MRTGRKPRLWSVPKSIAFLVLFVVVAIAGAILLSAAWFSGRSDAGTVLGLALVILGPIGAIAATVELIRSALGAHRAARFPKT